MEFKINPSLFYTSLYAGSFLYGMAKGLRIHLGSDAFAFAPPLMGYLGGLVAEFEQKSTYTVPVEENNAHYVSSEKKAILKGGLGAIVAETIGHSIGKFILEK